MNKPPLRTLVFFIISLLFVVYAVLPLFPPAAQGQAAPPEVFSAARAMAHVQAIAQKPHPAGSPAMEEVATYIATTLAGYGYAPEILKAPNTCWSSSGSLQNVVVRLPGSNSTGALLILAHPDSTPYGPGAGDDATGAAALLEAARVLQAGPALQNDIILLFDDGEECGYLGGFAFVRSHPWMPEVRLVIGLDTAAWGPVVLLQTTPQNGALIQSFARYVHRPAASGFFADADVQISQDTSEIWPFWQAGVPGIALEDPIAFTGKHSPTDKIESVRLASLQQMGNQVVDLARGFGMADLAHLQAPDRSFFTLPGVGMVHYPVLLNRVLAILSIILAVFLVFFGLHKRRFTLRALGLGALFHLAGLVASIAIGMGGSILFEKLFPNPNPHTGSYLVRASLPFLLAALVIMTVFFLLGRKLVARLPSASLAFTALVPWALVGLLAVAFLGVGSYAFVIPWLLGSCAWLVVLLTPGAPKNNPERLASFLPALVGLVFLLPNMALGHLSSGLQVLPLITLIYVMLLGLYIPVFEK